MKNTLMQIQEYRDMFLSEDTMWWYVGLRELIYAQLKKLKNKNLTILDAGCETGKNSQFLQSKGYTIKSIDLSAEAIKLSKMRNVLVKKASITTIPFKDKSFDVVLCTDVLGALHSDHNVSKAISEFNRVLKKNGVVIIQCAALEWLRSQHDEVINFRKRFVLQELEQYFTGKKWNLIKSSYRVFFLFAPLALIKLSKKFIRSTSSQTDQNMSPPIINNLLTRIQILENKLFAVVDLPLGSSVFLVARKK